MQNSLKTLKELKLIRVCIEASLEACCIWQRADLILRLLLMFVLDINPIPTSHLLCAKRIIKYINDTNDYGLLYTYDTSSSLVGYYYADWVGSSEDRKTTYGGCFFLSNNLISWFSKKIDLFSLSTVEVEYIAIGYSCTPLIWMKQMLQNYDVLQDVTTLYCDNLSAINISKNLVQQIRTKHIDIRHHFICDLVENKQIILEHISTKNQVADIFTKVLETTQFEALRVALGLCVLKT